jgi:hypothetical protein
MAAKKESAIPQGVLELYDKITSSIPGVKRKGAAMPYTSVNGHMFSFIDADGNVSLRLSPEDRETFIKTYKTKLSEQHGIVMKEYVVVPDKILKDSKKITGYFKSSYDYVSSLKPKPTKKK